MKSLVRSHYFLKIGQDGGENFLADQDREAAACVSYVLSHLNFKLLSLLLQHFGHIQSKNKDAKSAVSIF